MAVRGGGTGGGGAEGRPEGRRRRTERRTAVPKDGEVRQEGGTEDARGAACWRRSDSPGRWVTSDRLLVETHLPEETLLSTALFFLGFLAILAFVATGPAWGR